MQDHLNRLFTKSRAKLVLRRRLPRFSLAIAPVIGGRIALGGFIWSSFR